MIKETILNKLYTSIHIHMEREITVVNTSLNKNTVQDLMLISNWTA